MLRRPQSPTSLVSSKKDSGSSKTTFSKKYTLHFVLVVCVVIPAIVTVISLFEGMITIRTLQAMSSGVYMTQNGSQLRGDCSMTAFHHHSNNDDTFATKTIVLDLQAMKDYSQQRGLQAMHHIKSLTVPNYEKFVIEKYGQEHYQFLHYLTSQVLYPQSKDENDKVNNNVPCFDQNDELSSDEQQQQDSVPHHIVDIGTRYVASSLALGAPVMKAVPRGNGRSDQWVAASSHGIPVWTFDLARSRERFQAFRGATEERWNSDRQKANVTEIVFHNLDLLKVPLDDFKTYMSSEHVHLIVLDTAHKPYTIPFEREFLTRLLEINYQGLLVLDDIHFQEEMKRWWAELQDQAAKEDSPFRLYDVTILGHWSGTGLLDFRPQGNVVLNF